jgi:hypothetical protein
MVRMLFSDTSDQSRQLVWEGISLGGR